MSEIIPPDRLDPLAVAKANQRLWDANPELNGRQLTMGPEDTAYRKQWMKFYHEAQQETPKPPPPSVQPVPVATGPPPSVIDGSTSTCANLQSMTHEQKMEEAINRAPLSKQVREELGDIKTLVGTMVVVGGVLAALAFTGYGTIAEAIGAALLIIGAAVSGVQIGQGINSLIDFFQKTRCDGAQKSEDLDAAGKSFADAIAKMGIGGLNLLLGLLGARGKTWSGGKIAPVSSEVEAARKASLLAELKQAGVKHDPEAIVRIGKTKQGKVVFLEQGKASSETAKPSGLAHIMEAHGDDFAARGIPKDQVPDAVMKAVTEGKVVGYQGEGTGRPIYQVDVNGQTQYIAVTTGDNGYIVGANPASPE